MRISAKSRYALAALILMGQTKSLDETVTILSMSERLGISKIYLEQVFSLLRRAKIVVSSKGSQGGYQLARPLEDISVYDILSSIEISLFEVTGKTVEDKAPNIESVLQNDVFCELDRKIPEILKKIKLDSLVTKAAQYGGNSYMYYL